MTITTRVRDYAARRQLWTPRTRVVAAVSGGADSVAQLFLLNDMAAAGELVLTGVAHLNHQIRREASDADARFVEALAARLGLAFVGGSADVPALAARARSSLEVAARQARIDFLDSARQQLSAGVVALAHTLDDQAETLLLRLVRGAGAKGLGAMAPQRGWRIRPLLACRRDELRVELQARGETWREDHTNADRSLLRNRLRHEVLPLLRAHFNPRVDEALARAADILRIDDEYLADAAAGAYGRLVSVRSDCVHVDRDGLLALPPAISSRVALRALETADPGRSYGREQAARVVAAAGGGGPADLWGQRVERLPRVVVLRKRVALPRPAACALEFPLPVPGIASDPGAGWTIEASGPGRVSPGRVASRDIVQVDAGAVAAGLVVRMRRPGDWLQPLGLNGRKKVQDVFVDRKVPRDDRDRVPIVAEAGPDGRIVWVAGHVLAEPFGVTSATTAVVTLTLRRENALGGSC